MCPGGENWSWKMRSGMLFHGPTLPSHGAVARLQTPQRCSRSQRSRSPAPQRTGVAAGNPGKPGNFTPSLRDGGTSPGPASGQALLTSMRILSPILDFPWRSRSRCSLCASPGSPHSRVLLILIFSSLTNNFPCGPISNALLNSR